MKLICIVVFLFLSFSYSFSQTYQGKVFGKEDKKPIEFVSVSLLRADSTTVDFSLTDENGFFNITNQASHAKYLHFSCLGYTAKRIDIKNFITGSEFYLEQSDIALREVIVQFERIKQFGDTLNYSVSGFRMAQDRTIKDILRRLPGIEVQKDGRIMYQGIPIERFYVEGMNLTDGKYNLITDNLSAKAVKDVQVLENHQPISSLRGLNFSDKAALNLVLEEDAKNSILGAVDLGAGYEDKDLIWDNRLLAMLFSSGRQNLSLYKNNNTGRDITEELKVLTTSAIQRLGYESDDKDIFNPISVSASAIEKERLFFNDTHLISTNHLKKYSKEKSLRFQGSYYHDEEKQYGKSTTTYFLPENNISIFENIYAITKKDELEGNINYNLNSDKNYLDNNFKILSRFNTNNGYISGDNTLLQKTNLDRISISNEFDLIRKTGNKTFRLSSINRYNNLPQYIQVTPGIFSELLNDTIDYDMMTQNARVRSFFSHTYTSFFHRLLGLNVEYKAGLKFKNQGLTSSLNTTGEFFPTSLSDSLSNHYRYTETDFYLTPSINYHSLKFKGRFELNAALRNIYRHDYLHDKIEENNYRLIWEPALTLGYNIDALHEIIGRFSYTENYSDIYSLYPGYIFTSYRYATSNDNILELRKALNYSIGLNYKNPIKGLFYSITGFYFTENRNTLYSTEFNGILQQTRSLKGDFSNNNWGISAYMAKSLPFWRSQLAFKYNLSSLGNARIIADVYTRYRNESHRVSLTFSTQPFRQLNIESDAMFNFARIKKTIPEKQKFEPVRDYVLKFIINYIPTTKLQFKSINEYYNNTSKNIPSLYLSDLMVSYSLKKSEIQLLANNIFNNNNYKIESIGSLSQSTDLYILRSRQIVMKYLFNF